MGALLSEPITAMAIDRCTTDSWSASSASMQGWRKTHEDAHVFECSCGGPEPSGVFFVLDGHGGSAAAHHSRAILQELLIPLARRGTLSRAVAHEELCKIFIDADDRLRQLLPAEDRSGTTVVGGLLTRTEDNYTIHFAHSGDSRIVACVNGEIVASEDHKPNRADERARIVAAGGFVEFGALGGGPLRVDGTLAVSRAFGDFHFKPVDKRPELCKVTAMPEVQTVTAKPGDWILIACDGIFDVFTNEEVRDFVAPRLAAASPGQPADGGEICQDLLKRCLEKQSKDNCTAALIQLLPGCEVKAYERSCSMGGLTATTGPDIRQKYVEFLEAEGFQKEAEQLRNQGSARQSVADPDLRTNSLQRARPDVERSPTEAVQRGLEGESASSSGQPMGPRNSTSGGFLTQALKALRSSSGRKKDDEEGGSRGASSS